jgi:hypothetical protein
MTARTSRANLATPEVLAAFLARGTDASAARQLVAEARAQLSDAQARAALDTLVQTRLLSWSECVTFARLVS